MFKLAGSIASLFVLLTFVFGITGFCINIAASDWDENGQVQPPEDSFSYKISWGLANIAVGMAKLAMWFLVIAALPILILAFILNILRACFESS